MEKQFNMTTFLDEIKKINIPNTKDLDKNGSPKQEPKNSFEKQPNQINVEIFFNEGIEKALKDLEKKGSNNYATRQLTIKGFGGRIEPPKDTPDYKESLVSDKSEKELMFSKIHREDLNEHGNPINSSKKNNHYKLKESKKDGRTTRRVMRKKWHRMDVKQTCDVPCCNYVLTLPQMKPRMSAKEMMNSVGENTIDATTYCDTENWNKFCPNHHKMVNKISSKNYKENKLNSKIMERLQHNSDLLTDVEPSSKKEQKKEGNVTLKIGSKENEKKYIYNSNYNGMKPGYSKPKLIDWTEFQKKNKKKWDKFT